MAHLIALLLGTVCYNLGHFYFMDYKKIYDCIIQNAIDENRIKGEGVYYEAHHIIPKCMGGSGVEKQWKTHSNIVLLKAKEHWLCHLLLCEIYPTESKLKIALWALMHVRNRNQKRDYRISGKQYDRIRTQSAEENRKIALSYGERSDEYRKNISISKLGTKNGMYGKVGNSHHRSKPVVQLLNGIVLQEYDSIHQAAKYVNGDATKIVSVCKGGRKTHRGFGWKYKIDLVN